MKEIRNSLNLKQLNDPQVRISENRSSEGILILGNSDCQVLIEPEGVLYLQSRVNGEIKLSSDFLTNILCKQSTLSHPVKFTLPDERLQMNLCGEFPVNSKAGLREGFSSLKKGFVEACKCFKDSKKGDFSIPDNKKTGTKKEKEISDKITRQVEPVLRKNYEFSERPCGWTIYFRTKKEFHKINIVFDSTRQLLKAETTLTEVSVKQKFSLLVIATFLLHSTHRLRFVRATARLQNDSKKMAIGLESIIPVRLFDYYQPEKMIESVFTASRFTRLPCEALLNPSLADAYLKWVRGERPGQSITH